MTKPRANVCGICFESSHTTQQCPYIPRSQPVALDDLHPAQPSPGILRSRAASRVSSDNRSDSSDEHGTIIIGIDTASFADDMYSQSNRYTGSDNHPMRRPTSPSAPLEGGPTSNSGCLSTTTAHNLPGDATQYNTNHPTQYMTDRSMGNVRNLNGQPSSQYLVSPNLNFQTGKDFKLRSPPDGALATRRASPEQGLRAYTAPDNHATLTQPGNLQHMSIGHDYNNQRLSSHTHHYSSASMAGQASYLFDDQQPLSQPNVPEMGPDFDFMDFMNSSSPATYGLPDMSSNAASSLGNSELSSFNTFLPLDSRHPKRRAMDFNGNGYPAANHRASLGYTNQNPRNFEVRDQGNMNATRDYQVYGQQENGFANYQAPIPRQFVRTFPMQPLPAPPAIEDYENAPALALLRLKCYAKEIQDYGFLLEQHITRLQPIASLKHQGARFVLSPDMTFSAFLEMPNTPKNLTLLNNATLAGNLAVRNGVLTRQFGALLNAASDQTLGLATNNQNQSGGSVQDDRQLSSATAFDGMAHLLEERRKGVLNGSIGTSVPSGGIGSMPASDALSGEQGDNHASPVDTPVRGGTRGRGRGRGGAARGGGTTAAKKKATPKKKSDAQEIEDTDEYTMDADTGSSAVKASAAKKTSRKRAPAKVKNEIAIKNEAAAELINLSMAPQFTSSNSSTAVPSTLAPAIDLERDGQGEVDDQYTFQFEKRLLPRMQ